MNSGDSFHPEEQDSRRMGSLTRTEETENTAGGRKQTKAPLWTPDPSTFPHLNLEVFRKKINAKYGIGLGNYAELHHWSVTARSSFWSEFWDFVGVVHSEPPSEPVVDETARIDTVPKWFPGTRLNYAQNLIEKGGKDDAVALYYRGEGHPGIEKWTFGKLRAEVGAWARGLKALGVQRGDVVAGVLPNCPHTLAALLGTASLGAVWTCTSPDYGITGIVERFRQTEPKVIISVNAVFYNGKVHDVTSKLAQIIPQLTTVQKIILIPFLADVPSTLPPHVTNWVSSPEFLSEGYRTKTGGLDYEQVPFDHPLFIMYSSGTTGKPKCMVHSVGGTLLKHLEEHILQSDLKVTDVLFYYTTVGWMMYNWLISALFVGCPIVLYDGAPSPALWDLIPDMDITVFGTSAKWIAVQDELLTKACPGPTGDGDSVRKRLDQRSTRLRMMLSTGSPLSPQSFDFIYTHVKEDLVLGSISGGTDIIGCFMGQNPLLPVHRGQIQSYHLGCDLDCFTENGQSVVGQRGELVVKTPFPSMPTHFHGDGDGLLYRKAYFTKFTGIWAHGDFMMVDPETGGVTMLGRSDATLNPNGVRFGSAEIYQIVEQFPEISDSVCVAQRNGAGSDERVVLFLKFTAGAEFSEDVVGRLKKVIRDQLSPRHVPGVILPISEIPYTISGKKVEIAVRNVIEGEEVKNSGALANPSCLELYKNIPVLGSWS